MSRLFARHVGVAERRARPSRATPVVAVVCAAWLLSACSSIAPYPADWEPPAAATEGCPSLGGLYVEGAAVRDGEDSGRRATLSALLAPDETSRRGTAHIEVVQTEAGTMVLRFLDADGRATERRLEAAGGDFRCEGGAVTVPLRPNGGIAAGAGVVVTGFDVGHVELRPLPAHLLVRVQSSGVAVGFVSLIPVPLIGREVYWFRLDRVAVTEPRP